MLHDAKFPLMYWAEVLNSAIYAYNEMLITALHGLTPCERSYGNKLDVNNLEVFGCKAFVHVPIEKHSKLKIQLYVCALPLYKQRLQVS